MNTRFPITMGVEYPSPTSAFHFIVNPSGHVAGAVKDCSAPSRLGPRHWGQSVVGRWAPTTALNPETTTAMIPTMCRDVIFVSYLLVFTEPRRDTVQSLGMRVSCGSARRVRQAIELPLNYS
jgi:hypothetical protein